MEITVAIVPADLGGVVPSLLARGVTPQALGLGDGQLPGDVVHDAWWDLGGVGQEGAQESHRSELHGESEASVIAPAPADETTILVVEVKVSLQLGGRGLTCVAAVTALLILGQEVDGHPRPFPKTAASPRCRVPNRVPASEAFADTAKSSAFRSRYIVTKWVDPNWHGTNGDESPDRSHRPWEGSSVIACYCRVSSASQKTDSQKPEIRRWLQGQGIDPAAAGWFEDKETGRTLNRPAFDRLQKAIFAGRVKTVVVWKLDRISRRQRDGVNLLADWCERGVRVVAVTQQIDLSGAVGRMVASVLFGLAEIESEYRRERQAAGIAHGEGAGRLSRPSRGARPRRRRGVPGNSAAAA